jgi:bifunctional non-homologous end joining protein LigD
MKLQNQLTNTNLTLKKFPSYVSPQLCEAKNEVPVGSDWLYERKFDGYRICAVKDNRRKVKLYSRNGIDWTLRFSEIANELKHISSSFVFDGEIVVEAKDGESSFRKLQQALLQEKTKGYVFYVFDILNCENLDIQKLPLLMRKEILKHVLNKKFKSIKIVHFTKKLNYLSKAAKNKWEGIIAKNVHSPYTSQRNLNWRKIKFHQVEEFFIGAYTLEKNQKNKIGALLLGRYNKNHELEYVGKVGTGFNELLKYRLFQKLSQISLGKSPFNKDLKTFHTKNMYFVKVKLMAQIKFSEWTQKNQGKLRHAVFLGLREDKSLN